MDENEYLITKWNSILSPHEIGSGAPGRRRGLRRELRRSASPDQEQNQGIAVALDAVLQADTDGDRLLRFFRFAARRRTGRQLLALQ